jgi:filamentous hemagglutinin family protein
MLSFHMEKTHVASSLRDWGLRLLAVYFAASMALGPSAALALPQQGQVAHGQVDLSTQAGRMQIEQMSQLGVIEWQDFSIGNGERVDINQLNVDAALLNRVTGADPSQILGKLNANGRVYVVNPNGVLVGPGARINTAEFIASTLDLSDADFLNGGDLSFRGDSEAGVINLGEIKTDNGDLILVAQVVENAGTLEADKGTVALGAGQKVIYRPDADQRLVIEAALSEPIAASGVDNTGLIEAAQAELKAAGGHVYDLAINQSGVVRATGVKKKDGRILLTSEGGDLRVSGQLQAQDADGSGGEILVGGAERGSDPSVPNAANLLVADSAQIDISGKGDAHGGRAIFWSDQQTDFAGQVDGRGGNLGGDAGFVEVSGRRILNFTGMANLTAANGAMGTLHLDPGQIIVNEDPDDTAAGFFNTAVLESNLQLGHVVLEASTFGDAGAGQYGEIIIDDPLEWTAPTTLTLKAGNFIAIHADLNGANGNIELMPGTALDSFLGSEPSIFVADTASITTGNLKIAQNLAADPSAPINPLPPSSRVMGDVIFEGRLDVNTLDLTTQSQGIAGIVLIDNSLNRIRTLSGSEKSGQIQGDVMIVNGEGDLTVEGDFSHLGSFMGSQWTLISEGDLTLAAGTEISGNDFTDIVLASRTGSFINNAGPSAVGDSLDGRYLIYSDDPANTVKGGLGALPVYDKSYDADAPASITQSGSRFLYRLAPTLIFQADDLSRTEGQANPSLSYSLSGLVGGDSPAQAFSGTPVLSTSADSASTPGSYAIHLSQGTVVLSDLNYAIQFESGTLTVVDDQILFVTADDLNRFYGEPNPAFTANYSGFALGEDASIFDNFDISFSTSANLQSPVGSYSIIPSGAATLNGSTVTYRNGTLTIDPRLLTIRANDFDINFLDDDPDFSASYEGLADFDTVNNLAAPVFSTAPSRDVGDHEITVSGVSNPNYAIRFAPGTLTVNPRPITASLSDASREYGDPNPGRVVSFSNLNGFNQTIVTGSIYTDYETSAAIDSAVGAYTMTPSVIDNPNFDLTYQPATLTVTPAELTVVPNDETRTYGDANPAFDYNAFGLKLSDSISDAVADFELTTTARIDSNVGNYDITPTGSSKGNYTLNFQNGILSITQAVLNYLSIETVSRTYGEANPAYTLVANGLKNGDTAAGQINFGIVSEPTDQAGVGDYPITFVANSVNYALAPGAIQPGQMTITPRDLTIAARSYSREYGDPNPPLQADFAGLASFDSESAITGLSIETPATQNSNVRDYGINLFGGSNPNYTITRVPGTLSVTPATVNFNSADFSFMYGENADSQVVANYSDGLKLTDSLADLKVSIDAGGATDVGTYPLNVSLGNPNYQVGTVGGSVRITPRPVSFEILDRSRSYGDALDPGHTLLPSGGFPLVDPLAKVFRVTDPTTVQTDVGTYFVDGELINDNYQLLGVTPGVLRITPRYLSLKPENTGFNYGDAFTGVDYLTGGVDGLADFHSIEDVVADTLYTQYTEGQNFGFAYAYSLLPEAERAQFLGSILKGGEIGSTLTPGGYQSRAILSDTAIRNYYVVNVPGTVGVTPRPVTLTVEDAIGVKNNFINQFLASVDNPAPGDIGLSATSLFSGLKYEVISQDFDVQPYFQEEVKVADVPSAPAFTDAEFDDFFDQPAPPDENPESTVSGNDVAFDNYESDVILPEIVEVDADDSILFTTTSIVLKQNGVLEATETEAEDDRLATKYYTLRPSNFMNDNYVVTQVNMGQLTIQPDPAEVGAALEEQKIAALRELLYDPGYDSGDLRVHHEMALGFTRETIPVAIDAIMWLVEMQRETEGKSWLYDMIRFEGASYVADDEGRSFQQDIELFLHDLHYNPDTQAFMTQVMMDYSAAMTRGDIVPETEAQRAYKAKLDGYLGATKQALARKIKDEEAAWQNRNTPEGREMFQRKQLLKDNGNAMQNILSELDQIAQDREAGTAGASAGAREQALQNELEVLQAQREQIERPEAIQARITAASLNSGNMAGTLFAGDVPYQSFVQGAVASLAEERIASFSESAAQRTYESVGALVSLSASGAANAGAMAVQRSLDQAVFKAADLSDDVVQAFMDDAAKQVGKAASKKVSKIMGKALTKAAGKASAKIASRIFVNQTTNIAKAAGAAGGGAILSGVSFAVSTGISRAIIIGDLMEGEAYVKSLTENPEARVLKLRPDNVEGAAAVKKQNTRMQVDSTIFKLGFMSMMSGESTTQVANGSAY